MMDRRARPLPPEREQLELFDPGESVVPVELAIGTRRARRSSTRAWMMLVAIESSRSHSELRTAWMEVGRVRVNVGRIISPSGGSCSSCHNPIGTRECRGSRRTVSVDRVV